VRSVVFDVRNTSTDPKQVTGDGSSGSTVATTAPTMSRITGVWANNAQATTITLDAQATFTLNVGTMISVYGSD
jgi:hypothetical protein